MPNNSSCDRTFANTLKIRLRSDLCPGSGEGFASGVDSDVSHDSRGVPIIPGRRLKGCLRQAARDIGVAQDLVSLIFGAPGLSESGLLTVHDAMLDVPEGQALPTDPADVLDLFTYTRAQTRLNPATGTVADGTLRYTRVVRHFLPCGRSASEAGDAEQYHEATFHARLELRDALDAQTNEKVRNELARIARALKSLGLNRNRGLGVVACRIPDEASWSQSSGDAAASVLTVEQPFAEERGGRTRNMVALSYVVELEGPVMLPQQNAGRSQSFIPGSSVLGFFASRLAPALGDKFNDVFMGDKVRFSPLYPQDEGGTRCMPSLPVVVKLKGKNDGTYWNSLYVRAAGDEWGGDAPGAWRPSDSSRVLDLAEGTSFKPLKGGFLGSDWLPVEVHKTIAYHHSTGETTNDDGILYMQECLREGQLFGGFVECEEELLPKLRAALESGVLYFGRSKSAQYGRCRLVQCAQDQSGRGQGSTETLQAGAPYAFVMESDVALLDTARASYATDVASLCAAINEAVHCDLSPQALLVKASDLSVRTIGGYNAKWNQKRPQMHVLACGSTVSFVASAAIDVPRVFTIGERQAEGFGRVRLIRLDEVHTPPLQAQGGRAKVSIEDSVAERCRVATLKHAEGNEGALAKLSFSFVGRLSLMVRQAASEADLRSRISGLANEKRRDAALQLLDEVVCVLNDEASNGGWDWELAQQCLSLLFRYAKYNGKLATREGDDE